LPEIMGSILEFHSPQNWGDENQIYTLRYRKAPSGFPVMYPCEQCLFIFKKYAEWLQRTVPGMMIL
jgi:hypothetical protein